MQIKLKEDIEIEEKEAYISREIGALIIDYETNKFYETNGTGTRIMQLLQENKTFDEIIDVLYEEYDVEREAVYNDVKEFLEKLKKYNLLEE